MSVLEFNGYRIAKMSYQRNEDYHSTTNQITLSPKPQTVIDLAGNEIKVSLTITVGSLKDKTVPFEVACTIVGSFTYQPDEDGNQVGLDKLVRNNAVAILYPYARAMIATLTANSGEFPSYNLPTINVGQWLSEQTND